LTGNSGFYRNLFLRGVMDGGGGGAGICGGAGVAPRGGPRWLAVPVRHPTVGARRSAACGVGAWLPVGWSGGAARAIMVRWWGSGFPPYASLASASSPIATVAAHGCVIDSNSLWLRRPLELFRAESSSSWLKLKVENIFYTCLRWPSPSPQGPGGLRLNIRVRDSSVAMLWFLVCRFMA